MLLAAAPVITLPVVRLIRDSMLYDVQSPLPIAEVFLSGLLQRLPGQEDRALDQVLQEERERTKSELEQQKPPQREEKELELVHLERQDLVQYEALPTSWCQLYSKIQKPIWWVMARTENRY